MTMSHHSCLPSSFRLLEMYGIFRRGSRYLLPCLLICLSGCGEEPVATHSRTGQLQVGVTFSHMKQRIADSHGVPEAVTVDSLEITVAASDMSAIRSVFPVSNGTASGRIDGIPAGLNRIASARAWHQDEFPINLWSGSDTVDIEAGGTTEATITMFRIQEAIRASLEISPESTYVDSNIVADASGTIDLYSPEGDLEFRFNVNDTEIRSWSNDATVEFSLESKGFNLVSVDVRNQSGDSSSIEKEIVILNRTPAPPTQLAPSGIVIQTLLPQLTWQCFDEDNDSLFYTVRYDPDSVAIIENRDGIGFVQTTMDSLIIGPIEAGVQYFWNVTADDGIDENVSALHSFSTLTQIFTADSEEISYPCSVSQRVVTLENLIGGSLSWSAISDDERVSISPTGGFLGRSPVDVTVSVESRSGWNPGQVLGAVNFSSRGYAETVLYDITIDPTLLYALPESLELHAPTFADTIGIYNGACGDLVWSASVSQGMWLEISPESGTILESGHEIILVKADTTQLEPGINYDTLDFECCDGSFEVIVAAEGLENIGFIVDPDSIHIGAPEFTSTIAVKNSGYGTLQWSAEWDVPWLSLDPSEGSLGAGQETEVEICVDPLQLPSGFTDTAIIFTAGAQNIHCAVNVHIPGTPVLQISPRQIHMQADTDSATFMVRNSGTGRLGWSAQWDVDWLSVEPDSGLLPGTEQEIVEVHASRIDLTPGMYETEIQLLSNGGDLSFPVTIDVGVPGCSNPIFSETFNDGDASGWSSVPLAGIWTVQDGRYIVMDIPPQLTAWSQYALQTETDVWIQTDLRFMGNAGSGQGRMCGICIRLQEGETVSIEESECIRIGASTGPSGTIRFIAMDIDGNWFTFGDEGSASVFFENSWNSIGFSISTTGISAIVNGVEEIQFNTTFSISNFAAVGLTARGTDAIHFDRIYICELP